MWAIKEKNLLRQHLKMTLIHSLVSLVCFILCFSTQILNFVKSQGGKYAAGVKTFMTVQQRTFQRNSEAKNLPLLVQYCWCSCLVFYSTCFLNFPAFLSQLWRNFFQPCSGRSPLFHHPAASWEKVSASNSHAVPTPGFILGSSENTCDQTFHFLLEYTRLHIIPYF